VTAAVHENAVAKPSAQVTTSVSVNPRHSVCGNTAGPAGARESLALLGLENQIDHLEYLVCRICSQRLSRHPGLQEYEVEGSK
jgi:hypothetical protein